MTPFLDLIAGARPNLMKLAPVHRSLARLDAVRDGGLAIRIVHTGQHYDAALSDVFFDELGIPEPNVRLDVGSATHGAQTARILERYEHCLLSSAPVGVVVFGDVNSTVACALAATKLQIPVAHVEAGLRSFDRTMPEEINRVLTDSISDLLFVTEPSGVQNLEREGIDPARVHLVGNVMIDTLFWKLDEAKRLGVAGRFGLTAGGYGLVTLHRPSNVDERTTLEPLLVLLGELAEELPLVFPAHPRTRAAVERHGLSGVLDSLQGLYLTEPLPYAETLSLMSGAAIVLTDSGGIQEETSALGVPCLTLRHNTERPITVDEGTNRLVGNDPETIRAAWRESRIAPRGMGEIHPLWDGHAANRIAERLIEWVASRPSS